MNLTYNETEELLQSQGKFYIKLGLERIKIILSLLDNPQNKIKIIHIAGTNGKGSVSSVLANILTIAGYKTGLYTSPHLIKYTERIKINNEDIQEDIFAEYISEICSLADKNNIELTEFEILTVCAYKYFYDNKVDIAVIETGLGGRFDATNTSDNKLFSIITSISLDHIDRLGSTIEEIAFEKAGIINNNSKVILVKENKGFKTIKEIANKKNTEIICTDDKIKTIYKNNQNYILYNNKEYEFSLLGSYQNKNMALVIKAIEQLKGNNILISEKAIEEGFKTAKWRARLEYIKNKNLIIDGAHNPDAAKELRKSLDYYFGDEKRIFIYSTLNTKDYKTIAKELFRKKDEIFYYEFNNKNTLKYNDYIKEVKEELNIKRIELKDIHEILKQNTLKVISGSLYMIGELYSLEII